MGKLVMVEIPVTEEAAALLRDPSCAEHMGRILSEILVPSSPSSARLMALMAQAGYEARGNGLTDEMVDEELAIYNSERRS